MSESNTDTIRKPIETKSGLKFLGYKNRRELSRENVVDGLTGLLNRKGWDQKTSEYLKHAARTKESFAFVAIDLDNLKIINDSQGHEGGDLVLKKFADVMRVVGRSTDILARYGGDEYAACLPATSIEAAEIFKQRILKESGNIKLSIGVGKDYAMADSEMYKMKVINKNV